MTRIAVQPTIAASDQFPDRMICQAVIPLPGGDSLIYQMMGNFPASTALMPRSPTGSETTMTVHRRQGNDRPQILLSPAYANDYGTIAPDADYAKLPFTGIFRGQPNNAQRLYA